MTTKIAVVGAGGFVGATFIERALSRNENNVLPIIHSTGNAWRVTRWGVPLATATLLDKRSIARALHGCTHVVNCSRGPDDVMIKGLANLLDVCRDLKVRGFVHISSTLVYGDPPPATSTSENAIAQPQPGTYGWIKLTQDGMVQRAASRGLPCSIICPPNIGGPYSPFLLGILDALRTDQFALVDGGSAVCNLVDVHNLCRAVELALNLGSHHPARLFVTDDSDITWRDVVAPLTGLARRSGNIAELSADDLRQLRESQQRQPRPSIRRTFKHVVSSEVREALRKDPILASAERWIRRGVAKLGPMVEDSLRLSIAGPRQVAHTTTQRPLAIALCTQQLRGVRHSCAAAKRELGYKPEFTFSESMRAFANWYRTHMGMDSEEWTLLQYLSRLA